MTFNTVRGTQKSPYLAIVYELPLPEEYSLYCQNNGRLQTIVEV